MRRRASGSPRPSRRAGRGAQPSSARAAHWRRARRARAPSDEADGVRRERERHPDGEQERADRRGDQLVREQEARPASARWRCPGPRARRGPAGACCSPSPRTSRRCRGRTASTRTTAMLTVPLTIVDDEDDQHDRPDRGSTTMTIRRRSNRSAAAPPRTPNSRIGRYSLRSAIETRNGSRVCDATSSGPAASTTPSPALLTIVAARSQRKLRPSLAGTMASVGRRESGCTGGRIPAGRSVLGSAADGPGAGRHDERSVRQLATAGLAQLLAANGVQAGHVRPSRSNALGEGLPPVVERGVLEISRDHGLHQVPQSGGGEQLGEMALARPGQV